MKNLSELKPGMTGTITKVGGEGALRRHLLDMGLTPKTSVYVRKVAPMGDPMELYLRGYELTLRLNEAEQITVDNVVDGYKISASCNGRCTACESQTDCEREKGQAK